MSTSVPHKFEFLLFDGFSNMVLASVLEPLRAVKMRASIAELEWSISTLDGAQVRSSSGIAVAPDGRFDPKKQGRILVLVAGYHVPKHLTKSLLRDVRLAVRHADRIIAADAAAWILAEAGVLDAHSATVHWQDFDAFEDRFSNVTLSTARFVQSGPFLSCGGASTALDMTLDLIRQLWGPAAAFDASNMFVFDAARQNAFGRGAEKLRNKGAPKLLAALNVMAENVEVPLTTFELAAAISLSERSLNRAFQRELGITPGKYYRLFRLQKARDMAEETHLSLEQIALRCGFASGSSLSRSLKATFGSSLAEMRNAGRSAPLPDRSKLRPD